MPFGECTITLQNVVYQLGLLTDGQYISRYLTDFGRYINGGAQHGLGVLPPANCIDKFTAKCTWMQEIFSELPQGADDAMVRRYARMYIMMLLSTKLFTYATYPKTN
ncbi:hypothetical protein Ahy_B02g058336 [Arachis hypogaea]|uniref:Aminotransferase-like plant mobile domain-containing protein n=1 Tax=Arachis hypogaea TaxID=3818 RepID=A0A445AED5_ARAHY|nr:hypothetical protein Ahy_B02g058336 [Arachis hypogaea]